MFALNFLEFIYRLLNSILYYTHNNNNIEEGIGRKDEIRRMDIIKFYLIVYFNSCTYKLRSIRIQN